MRGTRPTEALPVSRTVGAHVATLRAARGWTLRGLARVAAGNGHHISYTTIGRFERATAPNAKPVAISVDDLIALATAFGVPPTRLLTAPNCFVCMDQPPAGFACRTCNAEA